MSLVGSLEDLGLVDILQIVSLSRKSGLLVLRSDSGEGRILLCEGRVQGATIKGDTDSLRGLLVAGGVVDEAAFERARDAAADGAQTLDEALCREAGLSDERLEALRREHVERSVMRMFGWRSGEFSFEIRDEVVGDDAELLLPTGLNTQYLAMEATRLGDEVQHRDASSAAGSSDDAASGADDGDDWEPVFSGEAEPARAQADATHALADAAAQREVAEIEVGQAPAPDTQVPVLIAPERPAAAGHQLIAIDSNLSSLEWLKASVEGLFRRVHIFQRQEIAVERIRHYLVRGELPILLVAEPAAARARRETAAFVARMRALAPAMPILALRADGAPPADAPTDFDGALLRPASPSADPDRWHLYRAQAERLRADLQPWLRGEHNVSARRRARGALARLKGVSDRLRDPSTQGEVLNLVLDFAAESFARVAMFVLRDAVAHGIAQRGLPAGGGPDDEALRAISLAPDERPELFDAVLEARAPRRGPLAGARDRALARLLGGAPGDEAYVAPLESGGCVVALVYADAGPGAGPLPDPTAFEIVLHEAGLALDRTLLERALAERG